MDAARDEMRERLERDAVELALALAEQIVAAALEVAARARRRRRRAARCVGSPGRRHVSAVVNPDDLEIVNSFVERLRGELGGIEHLGVQADRRIERGGARRAHR